MNTTTIEDLMTALREVSAAWKRDEIDDGYGAEQAAIMAADPQAWILIDQDDIESDRGPTMELGAETYGRMLDEWMEPADRRFLVKLSDGYWQIDAEQTTGERYEAMEIDGQW